MTLYGTQFSSDLPRQIQSCAQCFLCLQSVFLCVHKCIIAFVVNRTSSQCYREKCFEFALAIKCMFKTVHIFDCVIFLKGEFQEIVVCNTHTTTSMTGLQSTCFRCVPSFTAVGQAFLFAVTKQQCTTTFFCVVFGYSFVFIFVYIFFYFLGGGAQTRDSSRHPPKYFFPSLGRLLPRK